MATLILCMRPPLSKVHLCHSRPEHCLSLVRIEIDTGTMSCSMEGATKVAEAKYPTPMYKHIWLLDHSCSHTALAPDTLVASSLIKKPGEKQLAMRYNLGCETSNNGGWHSKRSCHDFGRERVI